MKKFFMASCAAALLMTTGCGGAHLKSHVTNHPVLRFSFLKNKVDHNIYFPFDSYELSRNMKEALRGEAISIKSSSYSLVIEGHTDSRGSVEYNYALGERRASSVRKFLLSEGVERKLIKVISYGKENITALGDDELAHSKNRRALIILDQR